MVRLPLQSPRDYSSKTPHTSTTTAGADEARFRRERVARVHFDASVPIARSLDRSSPESRGRRPSPRRPPRGAPPDAIAAAGEPSTAIVKKGKPPSREARLKPPYRPPPGAPRGKPPPRGAPPGWRGAGAEPEPEEEAESTVEMIKGAPKGRRPPPTAPPARAPPVEPPTLRAIRPKPPDDAPPEAAFGSDDESVVPGPPDAELPIGNADGRAPDPPRTRTRRRATARRWMPRPTSATRS